MSEESFSTKHKRMQREMVKQAYEYGIATQVSTLDYKYRLTDEEYNNIYMDNLNLLYIKLGIDE